VAGECQKVNPVGFHVNGKGASRLSGINQKQQTVMASDFPRLSDWEDSAHNV
jgi:hypothetical protein